jgi:L-ribulose-5-phosphate 3-epimerase
MKKAINQWCFPSEWSWEQVFGLAQRAGFQGLEICVDHLQFFSEMGNQKHEGLIAEIAKSCGSTLEKSKSLSFDSTPSQFKSVSRMAQDHGLGISTLLTLAQFFYRLTEPDEKIWRTAVDLVKKLLDYAVLMHAPNLLVVPGVVTSQVSYDYAYKRLEEAIWILKEDAEQKKVGLGIENVWGKILYSPLEMKKLVDTFSSKFVGVHFDVGNVVQYGYPDQWIRILGKERIFTIHLKDFSESINNIRAFTYLFQGDVPWERVMEALREIQFEGYLVAEVPPYRYFPEETIWDISRKMDLLIEGRYRGNSDD